MVFINNPNYDSEKEKKIAQVMAYANGTEHYHRVSAIPNAPVATDGVVEVAKIAGCFWLLDAIIRYQVHKAVMNKAMQVWRLEHVENSQYCLCCTDGNYETLISQTIEYSDFPLDEITLWVMPGGPQGLKVILLPSEH